MREGRNLAHREESSVVKAAGRGNLLCRQHR